MKKTNLIYTYFLLIATLFLFGCKVSYNFNAGAIDYEKYKSISIVDFPNNAELVNPTLSNFFSETLKDKFIRQTRLEILREGGDMHVEGEIVGYRLDAMAISADTYAAETKLTLTINVRFIDSKNPENDFEKSYSAFQMFDSSNMLSAVEAELLDIIVKEIVDNIYNDTVARW